LYEISKAVLTDARFFCLTQEAPEAPFPIHENPSGIGDLPTDTISYPGHPTWGDGIFTVGLGVNSADGNISCQTFGCSDSADAFFIEVPVGLEITHIHSEADPGDAERFILAEVSGANLFNNVAFSTFDFLGILGAGLYDMRVVNGQQRVDGEWVGFGSTGGNWELTFTVQNASPVLLPAAVWLFGSALTGLGFITRKSKKAV